MMDLKLNFYDEKIKKLSKKLGECEYIIELNQENEKLQYKNLSDTISELKHVIEIKDCDIINYEKLIKELKNDLIYEKDRYCKIENLLKKQPSEKEFFFQKTKISELNENVCTLKEKIVKLKEKFNHKNKLCHEMMKSRDDLCNQSEISRKIILELSNENKFLKNGYLQRKNNDKFILIDPFEHLTQIENDLKLKILEIDNLKLILHDCELRFDSQTISNAKGLREFKNSIDNLTKLNNLIQKENECLSQSKNMYQTKITKINKDLQFLKMDNIELKNDLTNLKQNYSHHFEKTNKFTENLRQCFKKIISILQLSQYFINHLQRCNKINVDFNVHDICKKFKYNEYYLESTTLEDITNYLNKTATALHNVFYNCFIEIEKNSTECCLV
ncbi:hypothetical protein A3Q56_01215 [Intoshia linei]|uniref:Uncharacterized protein n=1 Tax=Intoshia linei TaxID=1819745 RepID=A0A177BA44_9BILA|nr:hypothetical protein A3Q56_01215 [Intoshia linei]